MSHERKAEKPNPLKALSYQIMFLQKQQIALRIGIEHRKKLETTLTSQIQNIENEIASRASQFAFDFAEATTINTDGSIKGDPCNITTRFADDHKALIAKLEDAKSSLVKHQSENKKVDKAKTKLNEIPGEIFKLQEEHKAKSEKYHRLRNAVIFFQIKDKNIFAIQKFFPRAGVNTLFENQDQKESYTQLMRCVMIPHPNNEKAISAYLALGANIDAKSEPNQYTALHLAVRQGRWQDVNFLLEKNANPLLEDKNGKTPRTLLKESKRTDHIAIKLNEWLKTAEKAYQQKHSNKDCVIA